MRVLAGNILAAEGHASAREKVVFHELAQMNPHASYNYTSQLFLPLQPPLFISTLSIAISPVNDFPAIPSNITCEKG